MFSQIYEEGVIKKLTGEREEKRARGGKARRSPKKAVETGRVQKGGEERFRNGCDTFQGGYGPI